MSNTKGREKKIYLQSVGLTFHILREIAAAGNPVGVSDLSRRLGESKATVHRHLLTLKHEGILNQTDDDKYGLGWSLFDLGRAAASQYDILDIARPEMEKLCKTAGLSIMIGLRSHHHIVVLESIDSDRHIAVTVKSGLRLPAIRSSSGRVMLAFSNPILTEQVLQDIDAEPGAYLRFTPAALQKHLETVREQGYDFAEGESQYGVSGMAAPILNANQEFLAVISIIGTHAQIGNPPHRHLVEALLQSTDSISVMINN